MMTYVQFESSRLGEDTVEVRQPRLSTAGHIAFLTMGILVVLLAAATGVYRPDGMLTPLSILTGAGGILVILYARYVLRFQWISVPVLFLIQIWGYNFGLSFTVVFVPSVLLSFRYVDIAWFYRIETRLAMLMALLAAMGFVLGAGLMTGRQRLRLTRSVVWQHEGSLFVVGWFVMILGLGLAFVVMALTGGLNLFFRSYADFRRTTLAAGLLQSIQISQLGCMLAICGAGGRRWITPVAIWAGFGVLILLFGLRNEAMVPLVSFAVILVLRGVRFRKILIWLAVLSVLFLMPAIRVFRTVGFGYRKLVNWTEVTPLDTAVELGSSLRAPSAYIRWIDEGDAYLYGASYWAPLDRHFLRLVMPWRKRIPIRLDQRVPGQMMIEREGAVGTSTVGEAYYNFGVFGPIIYFGLIGMLLGRLNRWSIFSHYRLAILGAVIMVLFWSIRGQFIAVPAQITACLLVIWFCYIFRSQEGGSSLVGYNNNGFYEDE